MEDEERSPLREVEFENLITRLSVRFVSIPSGAVDEAITEALEELGRFVGADRSYVSILSDDGKSRVSFHEWCSEGTEPQAGNLQKSPASLLPTWTSRLAEGEVVDLRSVADLTAGWEKDFLLEQGNQSLICVPILYSGRTIGHIGFDSVREVRLWPEQTVSLLKITGEVFANAVERKRSEQALRQSEQRYRHLFERNMAGVYRSTLDGRILDCNAACARIFGFATPEELLRHQTTDFYFDESLREGFVEELMTEGSIRDLEIRLRRIDGRPIWLIESASLLEGGVIEGTLIDITDRKETERALRESESKHRTLVEQIQEGLLQVDSDNVTQYVNQQFCDMVGYSQGELLGRNSLDLLASEEGVRLVREKRELRKRGIADRYEVQVRKKNGQVLWMEVSGAPLLDAQGNIAGTISIHNDITKRRSAEAALRESEARYRLMAENSTDLISRHAPDGSYRYASPAAGPLLGYKPEELIGRHPGSLCHPDDLPELETCHTAILTGKETCSVTFRMRRSDGSYVWFETTSRGVPDLSTGGISEIISVSRDVTHRRLTEEQIEYQAYHDPLTNLPNRVLFRDRIGVALAHARRLKESVAILFLDLDHFKLVNDTFGHSVGDHLLQRLAARLRSGLREEDTVARMGGDEFTILLSDLENEQQAARVSRKLLETIALPVRVDQQELFVTASIGIAMYPTDGEDAETLLKNADSAMYRAKELGRNLYQLCTPAMNRRAAERLSMESSLRRALDREEFVIHYQPQIRADSGVITGVEALVRWEHPERGLVLPSEFIPIAEDTRLIIPLGEWVLRTAAEDVRVWQESGKPALRLAVNLSPRQFQQKELTRSVERIVSAARFDPASLELEITESAAMHQIDWTVAALHRLKEMGIRISIDDFGTGHSSLSYLKRFPIDSMKIDRAFVQDVHRGGSDTAIVSAVISIARGLRLQVVAEGVEREEQVRALRELGCNDMQGYYFCRPIPRDELTVLLERSRPLRG